MRKIFLLIFTVVLIGVSTVSAETMCTMEYVPVCGQPEMPKCPEGMDCIQVMPAPKTYSNKCMLNGDGARYLYDGECKVEIPKDCSSWYDGCNTCGVKDGKLTFCTQRACIQNTEPKCLKYIDEDSSNTICTMEYTPVCGVITNKSCVTSSNGAGETKCEEEKNIFKTYSNKCVLDKSGAEYKHDGECTSDELPSEGVDGSYNQGNGGVYTNKPPKVTNTPPKNSYGVSSILKKKAKNLINGFTDKLNKTDLSDEEKVKKLESIISKLKEIEEKKPKLSNLIKFLIILLDEKIAKYQGAFGDLEDLFNLD